MRAARLYLRCAGVAVQGQLSRRYNLVLLAFGQLSIAVSALIGVALLFSRFGSLAGYSFSEVLLCFGVTQTAFSLAEVVARGFDSFSQVLAQGEFDRMLVRPRGSMFQVLASRMELARLGRVSVGLACLASALAALVPGWAADAIAVGQAGLLVLRLATLALMTAGGMAIFSGIFILGASLAFITTDSLEIVNVLSDGGRETAQYPLTIYERAMRRFFTFVVPFGCVNYLPLEFVLGRPGSAPWSACFPLVGFAFLAASTAVWNASARRYVSTGS
ncbi:MAG TPA: ABC-2 family transporter protein [Spirochaetales bacterium]|nr:ABC-2 family transporter protein [Spirochaetales bacterium]